MKPWTLAASALLHAAVFGLFSLLAYQRAEFGIQSGHSAVEVELIAAAAASEPEIADTDHLPEPALSLTSEPDDLVAPLPVPHRIQSPPPLPPPPSPVLRTPSAIRRGDGSSPVSGTDATTRRADGGAQDGLARPHYLRNPPPPYPEEARRRLQEGLVKIRVLVSADGRADAVEIESSSGWPLLDQAALRAVKNWRFHPARAGGIAIVSRVTVPIRFELASLPRATEPRPLSQSQTP